LKAKIIASYLFQSVLNIGTRGTMATNVTLTKSSLVQEYLTYDGQDVIVDLLK